jgi:hypothetical protein
MNKSYNNRIHSGREKRRTFLALLLRQVMQGAMFPRRDS